MCTATAHAHIHMYVYIRTFTRVQPAMDGEEAMVMGASSVLMHCVCMQHSFLSSIADVHPYKRVNPDEYMYVLHDDYILITIHSCSVLLLLL